MAILSCHTLRLLRPVEPFCEPTYAKDGYHGLGRCSYCIRINSDRYIEGMDYNSGLMGIHDKFNNHVHTGSNLPPSQMMGNHTTSQASYTVAGSLETIKMPMKFMGIVHPKGSWLHKGIKVSGPMIPPGYLGIVALLIENVGNDGVHISKGSPIAEIVFHTLDEEYEEDEQSQIPMRY